MTDEEESKSLKVHQCQLSVENLVKVPKSNQVYSMFNHYLLDNIHILFRHQGKIAKRC